MGSQTKYKTRELVYVPAKIISDTGTGGAAASTTLKYVFGTNIPDASRTELGHVALTSAMIGAPPIGTVLGCSFPKPPKASKRSNVAGAAARFTSSFYDITKKTALKKAGWRLTATKARPKLKLATDTFSLVQTLYVTINGVKYAWNQPKVTETNIGTTDLTGLGIKVATGSDADELVFGANRPKPPRASIIKVQGDDVKNISTFYDPSISTLPANWESIAAQKISLI